MLSPTSFQRWIMARVESLSLAKSHVIFTLRRKRYKFKERMAMILKTTSSLSQKRMVLELLATSAHLLQRPKYRTKMAS